MRVGNSSSSALARTRILREAMSKARTKTNNSASNQTSSNKSSRLSNKNNRISNTTKNSSTETAKLKSSYTAMKKATDGVQEHGDKLLTTGDDSLFSKAAVYEKETQKKVADTAAKNSKTVNTPTQTDKDKAVSEISSFVEDYNTMLGKMNSVGGTVNKVYAKQLKDYVTQNRQALKNLGITAGTDGTLKVNQKTLASASVEKMQEVFGTKGGFADKVIQKSKNVEANAENNLASLNKSSYSSNYNRYGSTYANGASGSNYSAKS